MDFSPRLSRTGCPPRGFTLVELLVVIAVIGVLAAIGLTALPAMLENGRRSQCQSRLANLGRALLLYAQDHQMTLPNSTNPGAAENPFVSAAYTYTADILPYLGLTEEQAKADRTVFRCPSREYEPQSGSFEVPHYAFNGLKGVDSGDSEPKGLAGVRLHAIARPSRTVLLAEGAAAAPFSNHPFRGMDPVPDAKCWLFFVDGHTAFLPIFSPGGVTVLSDPPESYGYQWSPGDGTTP